MIKNNEALNRGGGMVIEKSSKMTLKNITIQKNKSFQDGGGIYIDQCQDSSLSYLETRQNKAFQGAGLFVYLSNNLTLEKLNIKDNEAEQYGGGIFTQETGNLNL